MGYDGAIKADTLKDNSVLLVERAEFKQVESDEPIGQERLVRFSPLDESEEYEASRSHCLSAVASQVGTFRL